MELDHHKPKAKTEQSVKEKKNQETGVRKIGTIKPHKGHSIFELDY